MNQLKNGTLLVVIATFVTAVLILVTGREDTKVLKSEDELVVEKQSSKVEDVPKVVEKSETENKTVESLTTEVEQNNMNSTTESVSINAPDGLFNNVDASEESTQEAKQENQQVTETSNQKEEIGDSLSNEAITAADISSQHDVLNHIVQPIWMDQKLGDFKSIETDGVVFKIMPTGANGLQGENPNQVVTSKSDKFGTETVSADYNYQQMPMYNGGYYIAPMPSYLMPSVLPSKPSNKE